MNRNPRHPLWLLCALVALAFGLAGCGGDEPAPVAAPPAPPPAPPPFQPQPVEVALGENGGSATLMTTEDGGFTLNGEAFAGGADSPVEGEGGRMYVLTLADGAWSAAFQPMEITVALGASEESATLMTTEAGGFTLGGEDFADGGTATNSAGAAYTLAMGEDGAWAATFAPMTQTVTLSASGASVDLTSNEQNSWMIGEAPLAADGTDTYTTDGLTYALARGEDGMWAATFAPMEVTVDLGASGDSVTLWTTEAGGFALDGAAFESGTTQTAANGNSYTLTLGADGMWSAAFQPMSVEVALGDGSSVTLWTTEAMGFTLDGAAFASGGGVAGGPNPATGANNQYTLTRGEDGTWTAAFVPATQTVTLGASDDSVTVSSTEAGAWAVEGSAFQSGGTQTAANGNQYTLTLTDGAWSAAFQPVAVAVELGDGASVTLWTTEAMGFTLDGQDFASGGTVDGGPNPATGANNRYTLTRAEDGAWSAAFVPATQTVTLGASQDAVTVSSTEGGGWAVAGSAFQSGGTQTAANGNQYTLALGADGLWTAAFKPVPVAVRLGGSGESVTLMTTEAMGFTLDGQDVASGTTTTTNSADETYVLSLADGAWTAAHRPATQSLALLGASLALATNEAGRWTLGDRVLASGDTVDGAANAATGASNRYELTLAADGAWSAAYRPATMTISGTALGADGNLVASANEDGSGFTVGTGPDAPSLDASGAGTITVAGAMFRVIKDSDDMLQGTRFDNDIAGSVMKVDTIGTTAAPGLLADNAKTDLNEKNTALEFHTADFSMGDLLGAGVAAAEGDNIVAKARADMVKIRDRVAGLVALKQDGGLTGPALNTQLLRQWSAADDVVTDIFGGEAENRLERTTSESRVLDAFDRLVDALSSESAFAAATLANGPDKLQGFDNRNAAQAAQAFGRVKWLSTARLGALGSTRFGAAVWNETGNAKAGHADPERAQAFAWSTMLQTRRSNDVRVSGSANYQGRTHAADDDGNLYAGTVDINVRFTRGSVDGRVDGLERADTGNPFVHGLGGAVRGIVLPTADLNPRASWSVTTRATSSSLGRLQYTPQAGGQPDLDLSVGSTFAGRLLGRGDQAGDEAIGTWKAVVGSTTLAGGFGATRGADSDPPGAAVTGDLASIGKTGAVFASLERRPGPALPAVMATDNTRRTAVPLSKVINTNNATFTYNAPVMYDAAGAEYVNGNYTPARATVLEDQDWEGVKGNWVSDARAEIVKKLAQLRRSIALDGADASAADTKFANDQRQRLFDEIQTEIQKVFGPGRAAAAGTPPVTEIYTGVLTREGTARTTDTKWTAHTDYPVNGSGVAQDAAVLAEIEDVIEALGSADAFATALADGGIFAATRTASAPLFPADMGGYPSASAIFGRNRGKLLIAADDTAYTRLGAWRHQVSEHAADALSTQSYTEMSRGLELGSFAYSPLDPTAAYSDASNRLYPASGAGETVSATYAGKTVAAQGDLFYRGDVEARVYWSPSTVTDSEITIEISDLEETVTGDTLQVGNRVLANDNPRPGLKDVESLTWRVPITNSGTVKFGDDTSRSVQVAVNSLNEDPFMPAWNDQLRFSRRWVGSGQNEYYFGTETNHYRLIADGEGAGTDAEDDFGVLSLSMVGTGPNNADERAPTAAEMTDFTEGVEELRYPKYVIGSPTLQAGSETATDAFIFVFADGSMLHYGGAEIGQTTTLGTPFRRAIGIEPALDPDNITASVVSGTPALSANMNQYLWTRPGGYGDKMYPGTISGDALSGVGAPAMSPDALFESFITDNDYVNVVGSTENLASQIEGMFVGQDQDGPLGIIGTWELTGGIFGTEGERGIIRGAFGADIQP